MIQTGNSSDRQAWANHIGRLIFSLNEVDWVLGRIRTDLFREQISVNWLQKTFSARVTSMTEKIKQVPVSPAMDDLKQLLARTPPVNNTRNHIAHGTLALVGAPDDAPSGSSFEMQRYDKESGDLRGITFTRLVEQTHEAMKLSNDFSHFFAMCQLYPEFKTNHAS